MVQIEIEIEGNLVEPSQGPSLRKVLSPVILDELFGVFLRNEKRLAGACELWRYISHMCQAHARAEAGTATIPVLSRKSGSRQGFSLLITFR